MFVAGLAGLAGHWPWQPWQPWQSTPLTNQTTRWPLIGSAPAQRSLFISNPSLLLSEKIAAFLFKAEIWTRGEVGVRENRLLLIMFRLAQGLRVITVK